MADYRAFFSNCLIGGEKKTGKPNGGWVRNLVKVELDGYKVEIYQDPDVVLGSSSRYKGEFVHSTDVLVLNVEKEDVRKLEKGLTNARKKLLLSPSLSSYVGKRGRKQRVHRQF
jgi:hypothetical protein